MGAPSKLARNSTLSALALRFRTCGIRRRCVSALVAHVRAVRHAAREHQLLLLDVLQAVKGDSGQNNDA